MSKTPRMGSDPFQKKDPLGWINDSKSEGLREGVGTSSPPSNPGKPSKHGKPSIPGPPSKTSNPSKHELPGTPNGSPKGMTTSKGLRPGWTRATFIVKEETVQQLKAVAYWDRKELKRVVEEALGAYLKGKDARPIPKDKAP